MATLIESLVRPEIRALNAYHVPAAAGLVKLDAMENPYQWPEDLKSEWLEVLRGRRSTAIRTPRARRSRTPCGRPWA